MAKIFKGWLKLKKGNGDSARTRARLRRLPRQIKNFRFDPKQVRLETVSERASWFRWGLIVLAVLLASATASRIIALFIRPTYTSIPEKPVFAYRPATPPEDLTPVERRNIFDVENQIPEPFDQGMLDCMSQARPTSARMTLLGTIVMSDETLSVALVQEDSSGLKLGVKKDEHFFDDKYQVMKIERKRVCFQVRASQEFEYLEIKDDGDTSDMAGPQIAGRSREGIIARGENQYEVKQNFLDSQLANLPEVLQSAKAVPYVDGSGKMKGFLLQSVDPESVFSYLGLSPGDLLKEVNGISLDNTGKGLEAFQAFRGAKKVEIRITRGGQDQVLSYTVGN